MIHYCGPMDAAEYHADPAPEPSMSAHDAHTLITRTAMHCWHDHPRLNPQRAADSASADQDEGSALHAMILEGADRMAIVDADDWRKKDAQQARATAREAGLIPMLRHRYDALQGCVDAFRSQIARHEVGDFLARPGAAEQSLIWDDESAAGPLWCRARPDWMAPDVRHMFDLKTTGQAASPDAWFRTTKDAAIRAVHYLRGARAMGWSNPRYFFVLLERDPPYSLSVCELSQAVLTVGEEQHEAARNIFAACLKDGIWPGFPPFLATIDAPSGMLYAHEDWRAREDQRRQRTAKPFMHQASEGIAKRLREGGEIWG